jgi:four helix bundle protein
MESYQDLKVWQKAMHVAADCYLQTKSFPKEESFGMTSQIRRAACSIPANIAEGWGRGSTKDYLKFLRIAQGSTKELETHLLLSQRVDLLTPCQAEPILSVLSEVSRMLIALIHSLESKLK